MIIAHRPAVLVQAAATLVWLIMAYRSGGSARSEAWCPLLSGQVRQRSVHLKTYLSTAASCAGAVSGSITSSTRHRRSRRMWCACTGHPAVPNIRLASTSGIRGEHRTLVRLRQRSCGFHNVVTVCDLQRHGWGCGGHAARSYWWISPSGTLRRRQTGGRDGSDLIAVRWAQIPGSVRAMLVVVRGVLLQDRAQVPWSGDLHPVGELGPGCAPSVRQRRWLAGCAAGSSPISIPAPGSAASNASVNCPVRSRTRNRNLPPRSPRSISRFRACRTVRVLSGCAVTPRT